MRGPYDSIVIRFAGRVQAPLLQLYALYVLFHGHYSPGGGFQAGAALAGSYLIPRLVLGQATGVQGLTTRRATWLATIGVAIYLGIGILSMVLPGGLAFLDYNGLEGLPWPMPDGPGTRAIGTVGIEVGVTMAVMGVMIILYDDLVAPPRAGI